MKKNYSVFVAFALLVASIAVGCKPINQDEPEASKFGAISAVVRNCPSELHQIETNLPLIPVIDVKVELISASGAIVDSLTTNDEGVISFINVPVGQYTVKLSHAKANYSLELSAKIDGGKTTYLSSDGFYCINYQFEKLPKKKWTFIHLVNNSEGTIAIGNYRNIRKQEKFGGSGVNLNNVVFFDAGRESSRLMYLVETPFTPDPDNIEDPAITPTLFSPAYIYDRNEHNYQKTGDLGDPEFMQRKIEEIAALYPSDSVVIFIHSHGSGIDQTPGYNNPTRSISPNPTTQKEITIPQFATLLSNLRDKGLNVAMVATDACYMGMFEVAYELKNTGVRYYLACEAPGAGLITHTNGIDFIQNFKNGTGTTYDLGVEVCQKPRSDVFALFDLKKTDEFTTYLNSFAQKINLTPVKYVLPSILESIRAASKQSMEADYVFNYYDLGDFALQLSRSEFPDEHQVRPAAKALYDYIFNRSGFIAAMGVSGESEWHKRLTGVSTLIPAPNNEYSALQAIYRDHKYYKDGNTDWDSFLSKINWQDPEMEAWDGSIKKPTVMTDVQIDINFPAELAWVADQVNSGAQNFSGKTIVLKKNLDMGGRTQQNWIPIGTADKPFKGAFDGGVHKIVRLYINTNKLSNVGLFGCVVDGAIDNCVIESGSIYVGQSVDNANGPINVGGICGRVSTVSVLSKFQQLISDVPITVDIRESLVNVGGLFGEIKGNVIINNAESTSTIVASSKSRSMLAVGGVVGNCAGGAMDQIKFKACLYSNSQMTATSDGTLSVGGIVGCNENKNLKLIEAENSATISARALDYTYVGGIVGSSVESVKIICGNNLATLFGSVEKVGTNSHAYVGGIVGASSAKLYACSSSGSINGNDYRGSLGAEMDGVVYACNALGDQVFALAAVVPQGKRLESTDTYHNSSQGAVGQGTFVGKNCEKYSATQWPNNLMKGWGLNKPDDVEDEEWAGMSVWTTLGGWNSGSPDYPQLKVLRIV